MERMHKMAIVKTHPKGQIIIPKEMRDELGIRPGTRISVKIVEDHIEMRPLPDDPIEYLTGCFEGESGSMAAELLEERKRDDEIDEANSL
jgi:AbrB family looped-hinge helix DNA binding protein